MVVIEMGCSLTPRDVLFLPSARWTVECGRVRLDLISVPAPSKLFVFLELGRHGLLLAYPPASILLLNNEQAIRRLGTGRITCFLGQRRDGFCLPKSLVAVSLTGVLSALTTVTSSDPLAGVKRLRLLQRLSTLTAEQAQQCRSVRLASCSEVFPRLGLTSILKG
jgi:hypothetical protein